MNTPTPSKKLIVDEGVRQTTNKYYLFHPQYREQDKASLMPMVKEFANAFNIKYDSIRISHKAYQAIYRIHSSEKGQGDGYSSGIDLSLIYTWNIKYNQKGTPK